MSDPVGSASRLRADDVAGLRGRGLHGSQFWRTWALGKRKDRFVGSDGLGGPIAPKSSSSSIYAVSSFLVIDQTRNNGRASDLEAWEGSLEDPRKGRRSSWPISALSAVLCHHKTLILSRPESRFRH